MDPDSIIKNIKTIEKSHTYQSGIKGGIDEIGKAVTTVGQAVNAALLPMKGIIWGFERISEYLQESIQDKLHDVPPDKIVSPNPHIVGPAIEALKFTAQENELRGMFSSLIANAMNADKLHQTHPAFVDMIKSMSGDDAKVMKVFCKRSPIAFVDIKLVKDGAKGWSFLARNVSLVGRWAGLEKPWASIAATNNLERMGLITVLRGQHLIDRSSYQEIYDDPDIIKLKADNTTEGKTSVSYEEFGAEITRLGTMFASSCVE